MSSYFVILNEIFINRLTCPSILIKLLDRMIKCHLSKIMGERKMKIADVARAIGVHRNAITLLYYEKAKRIDFDVIGKLCEYFNCTVGEILEYKR